MNIGMQQKDEDDKRQLDNDIETALNHWNDFAARFVKYEQLQKPLAKELILVPISGTEFESLRLLIG